MGSGGQFPVTMHVKSPREVVCVCVCVRVLGLVTRVGKLPCKAPNEGSVYLITRSSV